MPHQPREIAGQIDDRGGLNATRTGVQNHVNIAFESLRHFIRIGQWQLVAGQFHGGTHDRLAKFFQQSLRHRVIRHPDADRTPLRILQAARHGTRRFENKGIRSGRVRLQRPVTPVGDFRIGGDFREITTNQREIVVFGGLPDALDFPDRRRVAQVETERITGIRRIDDNTTRPQDFDRTFYIPRLRVYRMDA